MGLEEDRQESSMRFDEELDFWEHYRKLLVQKGEIPEAWHLKNMSWMNLEDMDDFNIESKMEEFEGRYDYSFLKEP